MAVVYILNSTKYKYKLWTKTFTESIQLCFIVRRYIIAPRFKHQANSGERLLEPLNRVVFCFTAFCPAGSSTATFSPTSDDFKYQFPDSPDPLGPLSSTFVEIPSTRRQFRIKPNTFSAPFTVNALSLCVKGVNKLIVRLKKPGATDIVFNVSESSLVVKIDSRLI